MNSSGGEVARYAQGSTIDQPLAMELGTTIDYYEADGLGSITSLTATNGTVAQSYTYDSLGIPRTLPARSSTSSVTLVANSTPRPGCISIEPDITIRWLEDSGVKTH